MAGFIELIAKIKPKNNGKYALVDDVDVEMEDGTRLSDAIKKPKIPSGGKKGQLLAKKSDADGDGEWVDGLKMEDVDKKLEGKLDKNLGSENPDKVLTTDSQGNIVLQDKEDFEGGGVTDYNGLNNRPSINGITLTGNKTSADLDMYTKEEVDKMLYEKMDKPYAPITISDDTTIEDCLDGYFKIDKIKGNTYQAQETDIVPTPSRPVPINSRKTTITKMNLNIFDLAKESDVSNIPDSGTYRSIGQHQLKPNTKYVFSWSGATVPAKATISFQIQDGEGIVLTSPFTYFNLESAEKEEAGKNAEFTTNESGIVKFAYNCTVATSSTTETYQQYWYTKILKDISLKEDVEYESEYVELRSLKETGNLFDLKYGQLLFGEKVGSTTNNGSGVIIENQYAGANSLAHVYLKANTNYFFIANRRKELIDGMEESGNDLNLLNIKKNGVPIKQINSGKTFTLNESGYYDLSLYGTVGCKVSYTSIMLVEGTSAPPTYIPPTVRDYKIVDHTTQTSKIVRNIGVVNLNNLTWTYGSRDLNHIRCYAVAPSPLKYVEEYCYCNVFECKYSKYDYSKEAIYLGDSIGGKTISIMANQDVFAGHTQEQFDRLLKEYINNPNAIAYYALKTPTEESIAYVETDTNEVGYSWQDTTSPSPTIKSEVKGVEKIDILRTGKNLFDIEGHEFTTNLQSGKTDNNRIVKVNNTTLRIQNPNVNNYAVGDKFVVKANEPLIISFDILEITGTEQINVVFYKETGSLLKGFEYRTIKVGTRFVIDTPITTRNNYVYIGFQSVDAGSIVTISNILLEHASIATTYEPPTEQHVNITLPQPLYENDIANVESENYEYNDITYVLDDKTPKAINPTTTKEKTQVFQLNVSEFFNNNDIWCDKLKNDSNKDEELFTYNDRHLYIAIDKNRLETVDAAGFKKWLKDNPLTFVGSSSSPATEAIPEDDLKIMKSLKTNAGVNNIFINGEVKPTIEARYPQDIASIVNKLQTKLLTLQEEVIKNV